jgi:hypothetical protein
VVTDWFAGVARVRPDFGNAGMPLVSGRARAMSRRGTFKVETRVRTPLGLPSSTRRLASSLARHAPRRE